MAQQWPGANHKSVATAVPRWKVINGRWGETTLKLMIGRCGLHVNFKNTLYIPWRWGFFGLPEDVAVFLWSSFDFCYVFLWWVSSRSSNLILQLLVVHRRFDEIESTILIFDSAIVIIIMYITFVYNDAVLYCIGKSRQKPTNKIR